MGAKFFALASLVVAGVIFADILIHPQGVKAFGNAVNPLVKSTYGALLGKG